MKSAPLLVVATGFAAVCQAAPVVQRNGIDGAYQWYPGSTLCFPTTGGHLDISRTLAQQGSASSRTLGTFPACDLHFGCSYPIFAYLNCEGSNVQIAGGGSVTFTEDCASGRTTTGTIWRFGYGQQIDDQATWSSREITGWIGGSRTDAVFDMGPGPYYGIRIQMADGWHYGWLLEARPGSGAGTIGGWYYPDAYGFETVPNTAIRTPCQADLNLDGVVDFFDYLDFVDQFSSRTGRADFNRDGVIDFFDYLDFVALMSMGC